LKNIFGKIITYQIWKNWSMENIFIVDKILCTTIFMSDDHGALPEASKVQLAGCHCGKRLGKKKEKEKELKT